MYVQLFLTLAQLLDPINKTIIIISSGIFFGFIQIGRIIMGIGVGTCALPKPMMWVWV